MFQKVFLAVLLALCFTGCRTRRSPVRSVPSDYTPPTQLAGEVPSPCDENLLMDSVEAGDAAKAMDVCSGLIATSWTLPDGKKTASNPSTDVTGDPTFHLGHGILASFGSNVSPRSGSSLLALSTGAARGRNDSGFVIPTIGLSKNYEHALAGLVGFPSLGDEGFLGDACATSSSTGSDGIALNLILSAPLTAKGFSFQYKYYTGDFTFSLCTEFADQAAALFGEQNLLKTSLGNDLNSNTQDLEACTPTDPYPCPLGTDSLDSTGYINGAATDWKQTPVIPVRPGEFFSLRLMIWDSVDGMSDSTLLLDNFRWR